MGIIVAAAPAVPAAPTQSAIPEAPGSTFFIIACVLTLLFAAAHAGGFLQSRKEARHSPRRAELTRQMRAHKTRLAGFEPTTLDFYEYFSANLSVLLAFLGLAFLAAFWLAGDKGGALRILAVLGAASMISVLFTSLIYQVFQGIVSGAVIALCFIIAFMMALFG